MKMVNLSARETAGSAFVYEVGRSAFSAVSEIVALSSTPQAVGPAEEDDCKSSIPGVSLRDRFHCLLRESMS